MIVLHPAQLAALVGKNRHGTQVLTIRKIQQLVYQAHQIDRPKIDPQTGLDLRPKKAERPHLLVAVELPDGTSTIVPAYIADFENLALYRPIGTILPYRKHFWTRLKRRK